MTAVVSPTLATLRRWSILALLVALFAVPAPAAAAGATTTTHSGNLCRPGDEVCTPPKGVKAPSPAPGKHASGTSSTSDPGPSTGKVPPVKVDTPPTSFWDDVSNFALTWGPLIFMLAITVLIGMTLRFLPRTNP